MFVILKFNSIPFKYLFAARYKAECFCQLSGAEIVDSIIPGQFTLAKFDLS